MYGKRHLLRGALALSILTYAQGLCLSNEFRCSNGICIPLINQCDHYNHCGDNSDEVSCVCYEGEIRLLGGPTATQGTVELCAKNQWASICGLNWTPNDAKVVCRQLGFNASTSVYNSYYGSGSTSSYWINVAGGCYGNETGLLYCHQGPTVSSCSVSQMVGVQCSIPYCTGLDFQCRNSLCVNYNWRCDGHNDCRDYSDEYNCQCYRGDVQLVGGDFPSEGTVQVCDDNQWGTVCDTLWTGNDAKVVCKQLGYTSAGIAVYSSFFGAGKAPEIWSDIGGCRGTEGSIFSCGFTSPVDCNASSFAGVRCYDCSPPNYFMCKNDHCIAAAYHCDGSDDCKDGSDEINCDTSPGQVVGASVISAVGVVGGVILLTITVCAILILLLHRKQKRRSNLAVVQMSSLQLRTTTQIQHTARIADNVEPHFSASRFDEKKFFDHDYESKDAPPPYNKCVIMNHGAK